MTGRNGSLACDVAIIGGGPAGSTAASLLRKYRPDLRVDVLEKEQFPRDHVGESQLPSIGQILDEMGCWDKVEAAGFPIKIGASYTWGQRDDRWEFNFYPPEEWRDDPRPALFEGQRRFTAFQVDRAIYDDILLRHAESLGTEVREQTSVDEVLHNGDHVDGLRLSTGEVVTARYYIDASGVVGVLRRALDVGVKVTEELRNIAIWDYWENAKWAVEIGVGATRVQVRSLPYGWIWFIPLGPTRTSIGLIVPVDHYKSLGQEPEALYLKALAEQPDISGLTEGAHRRGDVQTCKDWSQLADRLAGPNWLLSGEVAGFADPILAAGMSLAHSSARDAAYTILELMHDEIDPDWLRERYQKRNRQNIEQHIRFAQYWYSANGCFSDLQEHCQSIAKEAGLKLSPKGAWRWLSQGGFTTEQLGVPTFGSFDVSTTRQLIGLFCDADSSKTEYLVSGYNEFTLNLSGATKSHIGRLHNGRIELIDCWERGGRTLPLTGYYDMVIKALEQTSDIEQIIKILQAMVHSQYPGADEQVINLRMSFCMQALDVMIEQHWVRRKRNKKKPVLHLGNDNSRFIRWSRDEREALRDTGNTTIKFNI